MKCYSFLPIYKYYDKNWKFEVGEIFLLKKGME